jgi:hypothetical protein
MLFTDKFAYVHEPKTGGTFVTSVLFRLHEFKWTRWTQLKSTFRYELVHTNKYGTFIYHNHKHGGCRHIPAQQQHKPILATIRNPYDLYVSEYEFGWWRRREFLRAYRAVPGLTEKYPRFPNLSFAEYLELSEAAFSTQTATTERLGLLTERFVKFYFRQPDEALRRLDDEYIATHQYRADLFPVHFIRTEKLNHELYEFLGQMGYAEEDLYFIPALEKILPHGKGRSHEQKWQKYYSPELKQMIRRKDRLLFTLFPDFDV